MNTADELRHAAAGIQSRISPGDEDYAFYWHLAQWLEIYAFECDQGHNPYPSIPLVVARAIVKKWGIV